MGITLIGSYRLSSGITVESLYFSLVEAALKYEGSRAWQVWATFRVYLSREAKTQGALPLPFTLSLPGFVNVDTNNITYYDYKIILRITDADVAKGDLITLAFEELKLQFPGYTVEDVFEEGQRRRSELKYDKDGYDFYGFNYLGFDRNGYDKEGYDKDGYNEGGFDRNGVDREGYDTQGFDKDGYNREGLDREGNPRPTPAPEPAPEQT